MILVVGATGPSKLGGEICRQLRAAGKPVRALVRPTSNPDRVAELKSIGCETVIGDLKDRASLNACRDMDTVITTATTALSRQEGDTIESVDFQGHLNLLDASKAAGVPQFIYMSFSGHINLHCPLVTAKRAVEQRVRDSGMNYTILRPSYFMESWLSPVIGFDYPNAKATIYGSGHAKISWISMPDVARFTVASLNNAAARNATIELGGPEALSPLEVVLIFEEIGGKHFTVQHVPEEALQAQYATATDSLQKTFAALMLQQTQGDVIPMDDTLRKFPMIKLTSVGEYARHVLQPVQAG
jgi:NADH dehydrogenase